MARTARIDVQAESLRCLAAIYGRVSRLSPEKAHAVCARIVATLLEAASNIPKAVEIGEGESAEILRVAELRQAFFWECPECGCDNWEYAIISAMPADKQREIAIAMGLIEEWQEWDGEVVSLMRIEAPGSSTCENCGRAVACAYHNTAANELTIAGNVIDPSDLEWSEGVENEADESGD